MNQYDIAVIGAGPAGNSAAIHLSQNNFSVAVIEKKKLPRYKVCGGGLVLKGRNSLPFDISPVIEKEFFKIDIIFSDHNIHLQSERSEPVISMVMRDKFDQFLTLKAKETGAEIFESQMPTKIEYENSRILITTNQTQFSVKYLIIADGALSRTAKLAGWQNDTRHLIPALEYEVAVSDEDFFRLSQTVRFDMDAIPNGYGWSFPKEKHLSLGVVSFKRTRQNLNKYYEDYKKFLGIKAVISEKKYGYQIPVRPRRDGFTKKDIFLVGDAAGFADPLTAEGISTALLSGEMAAKAIIEGNKKNDLPEKLYGKFVMENILSEINASQKFANLLYKYPGLKYYVLNRYGPEICDLFTDVFTGERKFPKNIKRKIIKRIFRIN